MGSMAESFSRWESDPLFSAAEVVQESADRLESVFRNLLHEQSHVQEDPSDTKLSSLLQYHKRDLMTALETTRWQLEDFEREVNVAALSDKSSSRENAITKHRQFISAIREQIIQVEKSVHDLSMEDSQRNLLWMNLNEQETDVLASFLSGGDIKDGNFSYDTGTSITRRFPDSNMDNDEIIELQTEDVEVVPQDVEVVPMKGLDNADHGYDSPRNHMQWKMSHIHKSNDINRAALFHGSGGQKEHEKSYVPDAYDFGEKCSFYKDRLKGSAWGFLRTVWQRNNNKGSFTKRRKDGEIIDDLVENADHRIYFSNGGIPTDHQGSNLEGSVGAMQLCNCIELIQRKFQRSQYFLSNSRFSVRFTSAILFTFISIGFLVFLIAR